MRKLKEVNTIIEPLMRFSVMIISIPLIQLELPTFFSLLISRNLNLIENLFSTSVIIIM